MLGWVLHEDTNVTFVFLDRIPIILNPSIFLRIADISTHRETATHLSNLTGFPPGDTGK